MLRLVASSLGGVLLFAVLAPLPAQTADVDPPARHVPIKPATRQELDHLEAVKLYARGVTLEHQNRLIEAMRTYEAAQRLDPDSASIQRTLIPLYFALDRLDDALACCRRVLELEPSDYETGYRYARQLRVLGRNKEAIAVLTSTSKCPGLKDRLEVRAQVFYDLGMLQEDAGELDKAEKALREVLTILDNPAALMEQGPYNRDEIVTQGAETHERLGKLYLQSKKTSQAIEEFQAALKKDPLRSARLAFNLAEVYVSQGELDKALELIEQYLRSQPQGMEGYELRIKLQKKLGRPDDILPSLERSASADRNNQTLQLLLAREYRKAGQVDRAEPIYHNLLKQAPTAEVYRGLFQLYKQYNGGAERMLAELDDAIGKAFGEDDSGKKEKMDEMQREAAQREAVHARAMVLVLREDAGLVKLLLPAAAHRLSSGAKLCFSTSAMLAELAGRVRLYEDAEKLYRHCLRVGSKNEPKIYSGLLSVLRLAHKNQEIIEVCQHGLQKAQNTNRVLFLSELASAYMGLNRVRESLAAADEAVQTAGPEHKLGCRLERAQLLSLAERHQQAIAECQALLKEYNQSGDVHKVRYLLSAIYSAAQQYDKSEEQLLLILKDDPDDATANNDLAYLWADQNKKLDEAEKRIRRALELDKRQRNSLTRVGLDSDRDNAAFVDSLGWVLFRKGDWKGARRELEKATTLPVGDDDPVVWDHLGDVYFRLKEIDKAGSAWGKAIELYESGGHRRHDERYREIKEKLKHLN
ncbi:MAG TPA: tetratricopeptide repeat protein [Gemmataceae bacterium]|nr:tetratricopeptide repeat protein [Gemmataceae bacterium]